MNARTYATGAQQTASPPTSIFDTPVASDLGSRKRARPHSYTPPPAKKQALAPPTPPAKKQPAPPPPTPKPPKPTTRRREKTRAPPSSATTSSTTQEVTAASMQRDSFDDIARVPSLLHPTNNSDQQTITLVVLYHRAKWRATQRKHWRESHREGQIFWRARRPKTLFPYFRRFPVPSYHWKRAANNDLFDDAEFLCWKRYAWLT